MAEVNGPNELTPHSPLFGRRHLLVFLSFFALFHAALLRANLSVAIVAMTSNQTIIDANGNETYVSYIPIGICWFNQLNLIDFS